jgi:hypothetical protein
MIVANHDGLDRTTLASIGIVVPYMLQVARQPLPPSF